VFRRVVDYARVRRRPSVSPEGKAAIIDMHMSIRRERCGTVFLDPMLSLKRRARARARASSTEHFELELQLEPELELELLNARGSCSPALGSQKQKSLASRQACFAF
jgi:hypothetical protein